VEKLGLTRRYLGPALPLAKRFVGDADGESLLRVDDTNVSTDIGGGGNMILSGGVAVIVRDGEEGRSIEG